MNGSLFLFLCSILVLMEDGLVYTTLKEYEKIALFLPLGPPSTLIRHENRGFRTLCKPLEEFANGGVVF